MNYLLFASLFVCAPALLSAEPEIFYVIDVGAFTKGDEAAKHANDLRQQGFAPVDVHYKPDQPGNYNYRVEFGRFDTQEEALPQKDQFVELALKPAVRGKFSYDETDLDAAIQGNAGNLFNPEKGRAVSKDLTTATLAGQYKALKDRVLNAGETTSSAALAAYRELVDMMPDNHPLKGREVLDLAQLEFSGHSAYNRYRPDHAEIKNLILRVANKQTSATVDQRRKARDLVTHLLHYYDHNYYDAIRGYVQTIKEERDFHIAHTAVARASLSGAIFEASKAGEYPLGKAQQAIYDLWNDNINVQNALGGSNTKRAGKIRDATGRIGLMLSESYIEAEKWQESKAIVISLIEMFGDQEDCQGVMAEAYCHLANVALKLKEEKLCFSAADTAIRISTQVGKVWGDETRDTLFKAYAWKNVACHEFSAPKHVRQQVKSEMISLFPGHPGLKVYFGDAL